MTVLDDLRRTERHHRELWLEWSALDRKMETLEPCFHREYRYQRGNGCEWCDTHAAMRDLEQQMKDGAA